MRETGVPGLWSIAAVVFGVTGCGGGDGGGGTTTLDCALLASDDNCWHTFLVDVAACAPGDAGEGTLSADRVTCSYASGHRVEFDPAAPSPWIDEDGGTSGSYALYEGEDLCFRWEPSGTGMQITSSTATIGVAMRASGTVTMTCPDGERYETSDYQALLAECGYDTFTRGFPTEVRLENPGGFGVELTDQEEQDVRVFWCHE